MSSFKKPGFGSEIPVLGPILHHRKVAILENREAGYSQVGYRPSRNQVPGRSFDSRPIGGPDLSRVREAADGKLGCRPSGNQVPDNKSRFLGRFYIIGKRAFTKSSKNPGMWLSDDTQTHTRTHIRTRIHSWRSCDAGQGTMWHHSVRPLAHAPMATGAH